MREGIGAGRGHEVHSRAIVPFLQHPDFAGKRDRLLAGLPFTYDALTKERPRIAWDDFVRFLDGAEAELGGPEAIEKSGETGPAVGANRPVTRILSRFAEPKWIYWALAKWYAPATFANVGFSFREISSTRLLIEVTIPEPYSPCEAFFHVWAGVFRGAPTVAGLSQAIVDASITPRRGLFTVTPPRSLTIATRLKAGWRAVVSAKTAIEVLAEREREMAATYEENLKAQRQLAEHEVKLRLAAQMASAAKLSALGEMAGGVGHEINNPLQSILLAVGVLREQAAQSADMEADLERQVEVIERSARRAASVTHGLLTFARDVSGEPFSAVAAGKVIDDALQLCGERFRQGGVDVVRAERDLNAGIWCRPAQVSQVLLNLLGNAFDACARSPERWIRIEAQGRPPDVEIAVADSGPGVASALRDRIFEPFFTTKELGKGSGLGLSIAKGLIESQGGTLALDTASRCTRFVVRLPASPR